MTNLTRAIGAHLSAGWKTDLTRSPRTSPLPYPLQTCLLGELGCSNSVVVRACAALNLSVPPGIGTAPEARATLEATLQAAGFHAMDRPVPNADEATLMAMLRTSQASTRPGGATNDIELTGGGASAAVTNALFTGPAAATINGVAGLAAAAAIDLGAAANPGQSIGQAFCVPTSGPGRTTFPLHLPPHTCAELRTRLGISHTRLVCSLGTPPLPQSWFQSRTAICVLP